MGSWGVKSYEIDEADEALDAGFDRVHGDEYDRLMDDRNPMTLDQIHNQLANSATLDASITALRETFGEDFETWDEVARLAYAGVVVRHAECKTDIPAKVKEQAIDWLTNENIDWEEATARRLRRQKEVALLKAN
jgi:hypothetical protein